MEEWARVPEVFFKGISRWDECQLSIRVFKFLSLFSPLSLHRSNWGYFTCIKHLEKSHSLYDSHGENQSIATNLPPKGLSLLESAWRWGPHNKCGTRHKQSWSLRITGFSNSTFCLQQDVLLMHPLYHGDKPFNQSI